MKRRGNEREFPPPKRRMLVHEDDDENTDRTDPRRNRKVHFGAPDRFEKLNTEEGEKQTRLQTEDLIDLKPEEIATLKNYKKEISDDMENLAHLESSRTNRFEKYKNEEDEEDEAMEKFTSEEEEARRCLRDPLAKRRERLAKQHEREVEDHWYHEYMESQRKKPPADSFLSIEASLARTERLAKQKTEKMDEDEDEDLDKLTEAEIMKRIASILHENENIAQSLRRLSGMPSGKSRRRKQIASANTSGEDKILSDKLTELSTICISRGYFPDIYTVKREEFLKRVGEQLHGKEKQKAEVMWEYKTPDSNIFGPYNTQTMKAWFDQGYFANDVPVRKVGDSDFISASQVKFC